MTAHKTQLTMPLTSKERLFWQTARRALQVAQRAAAEFARACTIAISGIDELLKEQ